MRIDLHTHSTASDGTEAPAQVLRSAAEAGLDLIALTDHDTTRGWDEAADVVGETGVALVRGIEISCERGSTSVHLLGYLTDPAAPGLTGEIDRARASRVTRLERMVRLMEEAGLPISYAEVLASVPDGATPGRPHIADALVSKGVVSHRDEAFARWLSNDSRFYVSHYTPDPVRAVELVVEAGGVAVMAHPFTQSPGRQTSDDLIAEMAAAGLAGVEVWHRDNDEVGRKRGLALADRLGLLVTGSSDYHGEGKRNRLGENVTAATVFDEIEHRSSGVTPVLRP